MSVSEDLWLTLESTNMTDVGYHDLTLVVYLQKFDNITLEVPFSVQVDSCKLESVEAVQTNVEAVYLVGTGKQLIDLPPFEQVPACNYPMSKL